jgi:hypothetical protein
MDPVAVAGDFDVHDVTETGHFMLAFHLIDSGSVSFSECSSTRNAVPTIHL